MKASSPRPETTAGFKARLKAAARRISTLENALALGIAEGKVTLDDLHAMRNDLYGVDLFSSGPDDQRDLLRAAARAMAGLESIMEEAVRTGDADASDVSEMRASLYSCPRWSELTWNRIKRDHLDAQRVEASA